jgi:predicted nucleic acid-binding protein
LNKALLDTDTVSEIGKSKNQTVASNAKTYRRSFGHYTISTVTVMEIVRGFQKAQATARMHAFLATLPYMELLSLDLNQASYWIDSVKDSEKKLETPRGLWNN